MRKYILPVLLIFSWPVSSAYIHGRVAHVLDGDIIEVMDSREAARIRLASIDAPEKKQNYGRWSTDIAGSLVAGETVTVTYSQQDRYDRILGQACTLDGTNTSQFMARVGAVWVYKQYNTGLHHNSQVADFKEPQYPLRNDPCLSIEEMRCRRQEMQ